MLTGFNIFILIIIAVLGLVVGSFLNVLIFRIDNLKSVLKGRSYCPHCKKTLLWKDLVPLFSFLILGGKCRYCRKNISWQYPIIEATTGIVFALLYSHFSDHPLTFIYYAVVFSLLIVVLTHDYLTQYIQEEFMVPALILIFVLSWYFGGFGFLNMIYGGLIGAGIPAILVLISKEKWMGRGDIEVGLALGLLLGFPVAVFGFFLACFLGSIYGLILMYYKNITLKARVPFAPALIIATFLSLIWGERIVNWYLNTLI